MKQEITIADVEQNYHYAVEHIDFCRQLALSDEVPENAPWFDKRTIARWLYGSITEFAAEYFQTLNKFGPTTREQNKPTINFSLDVYLRIKQAKKDIERKYPGLLEVIP